MKQSDDTNIEKNGNVNHSRNLKRNSSESVSLLRIESIDCSDDIKRKITRKVKKFQS